MSSAYEDKPGADETAPPAAAVTTTAPAPPLVSLSGPMAAPGEATWGNGPGLNVRYAGRTAVGLVREHNEDNFLIANLTNGELSEREMCLIDVVGEGGLLFAVCDGMGGAAAGEVASQMAVDVLLEAMRRGGNPGERDVLARRLVSAVEEAGRRIFDSAQKERSRRGMGTTATVSVLIDKVLFVAEVGDSRAYLMRAGQLKQLTKDQSLVNQLIEAGHLTEAEAEAFEHSNIILQALGTSETVQVDLTFVELRRGDRLMMCSDGLSGLVHNDTLRETLSGVDDPAECSAALIRYAEAGGGHDNITVVIVDFDGEALELPRESDSFGYLQYPLVPAASVSSTFSEEEVTEATKPLSMGNYEPVPSYHPPVAPGVDTSPWLWVSAGLAALLVGTWLLAMGGSAGGAVTALEDAPTSDDSNLGNSLPSPAPGSAAAMPSAEPEAAEEAKGVPVHVHSDVDDAVLLVNGESHGALATGDGQTLDLPPGAYRFEAQTHGNVAAFEVVNVRPDAPVDVFLRLPQGANANAAGTANAAATPAAAAKAAGELAAPSGETGSAPVAPALKEPSKTPAPAATGSDSAPPPTTPKAPPTAAPAPFSAPGASRAAPPGGTAAAPVRKPAAQAPRPAPTQLPHAPAPAQTQPQNPAVNPPANPPASPPASAIPPQPPASAAPAHDPQKPAEAPPEQAPPKPSNPIPANPF